MKRYDFEQNAGQSGDIVFEKSIDGSVKGATPGEWVVLVNKKTKEQNLGFINPFRTDGKVARIVGSYESGVSVEGFVEARLMAAQKLRDQFLPNQSGRLFFGSSDGIPGLVIDKFENLIIVQYHMLGAQKISSLILKHLKKLYPEITICENTKPEPGEELLAVEAIYPDRIIIKEQGIEYSISKDRFQKTGFYYDHRANRTRLFEFFQKRGLRPKRVLDLYSYLGSWSAPFHCHLGSQIHCIDQADLEQDFNEFFERYENKSESEFIRSNVTKYLDSVKDSHEYDLIICDPPAFKKGQDKKKEALLGYEGLVKRIVPMLKAGSAFAFSSCTHGINHQDLDSLVTKIATRTNKKIQLVDIGLQDIDHPMTSLSDKSMYIKYLLYICKE